MMGPDYAHWHGSYEVAEEWYNVFIPEVTEIIERAKLDPDKEQGAIKAEEVVTDILGRVDHDYPYGRDR